ncbi:unnamed protein product [Amoebophrya sp. A120]|nr:unnamed protein product [Amoebophrya sp. A120]|eukprot:GSA120T00019288001.1
MEFAARLTQVPLKRFYKYVLRRFLGGFLRKDLDLDNLEVSLQMSHGVLELRNLELETDLLNEHLQDSPFKLLDGAVGYLRMEIPWSRLLEKSCKIYIADLHVSGSILSSGKNGSAGDDQDVDGINSSRPDSPDHQHSSSSTSNLFSSATSKMTNQTKKKQQFQMASSDYDSSRGSSSKGKNRSTADKKKQEPQSSGYGDEGVETLSRLVQHVLGNMEVCLKNVRLSLFSEDPEEDIGGAPSYYPYALQIIVSSALVFADSSAQRNTERNINRDGRSRKKNSSVSDTTCEEERRIQIADVAIQFVPTKSTSNFQENAIADSLVLDRAPVLKEDLILRTDKAEPLSLVVRKNLDGENMKMEMEVDLHIAGLHAILSLWNVRRSSEFLTFGSQQSALREQLRLQQQLHKNKHYLQTKEAQQDAELFHSFIEPKPSRNFWYELYALFETESILEDNCSEEDGVSNSMNNNANNLISEQDVHAATKVLAKGKKRRKSGSSKGTGGNVDQMKSNNYAGNTSNKQNNQPTSFTRCLKINLQVDRQSYFFVLAERVQFVNPWNHLEFGSGKVLNGPPPINSVLPYTNYEVNIGRMGVCIADRQDEGVDAAAAKINGPSSSRSGAFSPTSSNQHNYGQHHQTGSNSEQVHSANQTSITAELSSIDAFFNFRVAREPDEVFLEQHANTDQNIRYRFPLEKEFKNPAGNLSETVQADLQKFRTIVNREEEEENAMFHSVLNESTKASVLAGTTTKPVFASPVELQQSFPPPLEQSDSYGADMFQSVISEGTGVGAASSTASNSSPATTATSNAAGPRVNLQDADEAAMFQSMMEDRDNGLESCSSSSGELVEFPTSSPSSTNLNLPTTTVFGEIKIEDDANFGSVTKSGTTSTSAAGGAPIISGDHDSEDNIPLPFLGFDRPPAGSAQAGASSSSSSSATSTTHQRRDEQHDQMNLKPAETAQATLASAPQNIAEQLTERLSSVAGGQNDAEGASPSSAPAAATTNKDVDHVVNDHDPQTTYDTSRPVPLSPDVQSVDTETIESESLGTKKSKEESILEETTDEELDENDFNLETSVVDLEIEFFADQSVETLAEKMRALVRDQVVMQGAATATTMNSFGVVQTGLEPRTQILSGEHPASTSAQATDGSESRASNRVDGREVGKDKEISDADPSAGEENYTKEKNPAPAAAPGFFGRMFGGSPRLVTEEQQGVSPTTPPNELSNSKSSLNPEPEQLEDMRIVMPESSKPRRGDWVGNLQRLTFCDGTKDGRKRILECGRDPVRDRDIGKKGESNLIPGLNATNSSSSTGSLSDTIKTDTEIELNTTESNQDSDSGTNYLKKTKSLSSSTSSSNEEVPSLSSSVSSTPSAVKSMNARFFGYNSGGNSSGSADHSYPSAFSINIHKKEAKLQVAPYPVVLDLCPRSIECLSVILSRCNTKSGSGSVAAEQAAGSSGASAAAGASGSGGPRVGTGPASSSSSRGVQQPGANYTTSSNYPAPNAKIPRPGFLPETTYSRRLNRSFTGIEQADNKENYAIFTELQKFELRLRLGKPRGRLCTLGLELPDIVVSAGGTKSGGSTSGGSRSSSSSASPQRSGGSANKTPPGGIDYFTESWKLSSGKISCFYYEEDVSSATSSKEEQDTTTQGGGAQQVVAAPGTGATVLVTTQEVDREFGIPISQKGARIVSQEGTQDAIVVRGFTRDLRVLKFSEGGATNVVDEEEQPPPADHDKATDVNADSGWTKISLPSGLAARFAGQGVNRPGSLFEHVQELGQKFFFPKHQQNNRNRYNKSGMNNRQSIFEQQKKQRERRQRQAQMGAFAGGNNNSSSSRGEIKEEIQNINPLLEPSGTEIDVVANPLVLHFDSKTLLSLVESFDHFATSFGNSAYLNQLMRKRYDPVKRITSLIEESHFSTLGVSVYVKSVWLEVLPPVEAAATTAAPSSSTEQQQGAATQTAINTTPSSDSNHHLKNIWIGVGAVEARYVAIATGAFRVGLLGRDLRAIGERPVENNSKQSVEYLAEPWWVPLRAELLPRRFTYQKPDEELYCCVANEDYVMKGNVVDFDLLLEEDEILQVDKGGRSCTTSVNSMTTFSTNALAPCEFRFAEQNSSAPGGMMNPGGPLHQQQQQQFSGGYVEPQFERRTFAEDRDHIHRGRTSRGTAATNMGGGSSSSSSQQRYQKNHQQNNYQQTSTTNPANQRRPTAFKEPAVEGQRSLFSSSASSSIYLIEEHVREKFRQNLMSANYKQVSPQELLEKKHEQEQQLVKQKYKIPVNFFRKKNAIFEQVDKNTWADSGCLLLVLDQKKIGHSDSGGGGAASSTASAAAPGTTSDGTSRAQAAPSTPVSPPASNSSTWSTLYLFELTLVLSRLSLHFHPHMYWSYADLLEFFAPPGYSPPPMTEECLDRDRKSFTKYFIDLKDCLVQLPSEGYSEKCLADITLARRGKAKTSNHSSKQSQITSSSSSGSGGEQQPNGIGTGRVDPLRLNNLPAAAVGAATTGQHLRDIDFMSPRGDGPSGNDQFSYGENNLMLASPRSQPSVTRQSTTNQANNLQNNTKVECNTVITLSKFELATGVAGTQYQGFRIELGEFHAYVIDKPEHLLQTHLRIPPSRASLTSILSSLGFAHVLEAKDAAILWKVKRDLSNLQLASQAAAQAGLISKHSQLQPNNAGEVEDEHSLDVRCKRIALHACSDTLQCLLNVLVEAQTATVPIAEDIVQQRKEQIILNSPRTSDVVSPRGSLPAGMDARGVLPVANVELMPPPAIPQLLHQPITITPMETNQPVAMQGVGGLLHSDIGRDDLMSEQLKHVPTLSSPDFTNNANDLLQLPDPTLSAGGAAGASKMNNQEDSKVEFEMFEDQEPEVPSYQGTRRPSILSIPESSGSGGPGGSGTSNTEQLLSDSPRLFLEKEEQLASPKLIADDQRAVRNMTGGLGQQLDEDDNDFSIPLPFAPGMLDDDDDDDEDSSHFGSPPLLRPTISSKPASIVKISSKDSKDHNRGGQHPRSRAMSLDSEVGYFSPVEQGSNDDEMEDVEHYRRRFQQELQQGGVAPGARGSMTAGGTSTSSSFDPNGVEVQQHQQSDEQGEPVTVCYFNRDAYSNAELRNFRDEERVARREIANMYSSSVAVGGVGDPVSSAAVPGHRPGSTTSGQHAAGAIASDPRRREVVRGPGQQQRGSTTTSSSSSSTAHQRQNTNTTSGGFRNVVAHQHGSATRWFVPPDRVSIKHDQFLYADREDSPKDLAGEKELELDGSRVAKNFSFKCEELSLAIYGGTDFAVDRYQQKLQALVSTSSSPGGPGSGGNNYPARLHNRRRKDLSLILQLRKMGLKLLVPVKPKIQQPTNGFGFTVQPTFSKTSTSDRAVHLPPATSDLSSNTFIRVPGGGGTSSSGSHALFQALPCDILDKRIVLHIRDITIKDEVQSSAFQHVLAYYQDEKKRPRPSDLDMLVVKLDSFTDYDSLRELQQQSSSQQQAARKEYTLDVKLLPIRLTLDQDVVDFVLRFVRLTTLPSYIEEVADEEDEMVSVLSNSAMNNNHAPAHGTTFSASSAAGNYSGTANMELSADHDAGPRGTMTGHSASSSSSSSSALGPKFQHVRISALLAVMDYRAKRLDMQALQRGDLTELINLLPLLEGLEIAFRSVKVQQVVGTNKLLQLLVDQYANDLNRSQILRSLSGITPIRSFANIGVSLTEFVKEPLQVALQDQLSNVGNRMGAGSLHSSGHTNQLSRSLVRGTTAFLKNLTIESLELTEKAFFATQSVLEFAEKSIDQKVNQRMPGTSSGSAYGTNRSRSSRNRGTMQPAAIYEEERDENGDVDPFRALIEDEDWTTVDKGARESMQPADGLEGLQMGFENLKRNVKDAGRIISQPIHSRQIQSGDQLIKHFAKGVPVCILKPVIGATSMAATTLRGVRNSMDGERKEELERKYKVPG